MGKQKGAEYRAKNRSRQNRLRKGRKAKGQRQVSVWLDELAFSRLAHFQKMSGRTQADIISDGLRALDMVERKVMAELRAEQKAKQD
jgi:hypothetical protein